MSQLMNGEQMMPTNQRISPWINVLLLGVFVAIPYLIHKISNNIRQAQIKGNYINCLQLEKNQIDQSIICYIIVSKTTI